MKREYKQCLFYDPKKTAHLKAAMAITDLHLALINDLQKVWNNVFSNFRKDVKAKTDLISKEIVCPFREKD